MADVASMSRSSQPIEAAPAVAIATFESRAIRSPAEVGTTTTSTKHAAPVAYERPSPPSGITPLLSCTDIPRDKPAVQCPYSLAGATVRVFASTYKEHHMEGFRYASSN